MKLVISLLFLFSVGCIKLYSQRPITINSGGISIVSSPNLNKNRGENYGSNVVYITIAITDSGFFFPRGVFDFKGLFNVQKQDTVPSDGMNIMRPGKIPMYLGSSRFRIMLYTVPDSLSLQAGCWRESTEKF